eukprot:COSAG06_NODE_972_length_11272_cov_25.599123_8_plen_293_part_00
MDEWDSRIYIRQPDHCGHCQDCKCKLACAALALIAIFSARRWDYSTYNCHASKMLVGAAGRYHSAAARASTIYSFLQLLLFQPASLLVFDPLGAQRGRCGTLPLAQCVPLLLLVRGQRGQRVQPPRRAGSAAGSAPVARSAPPMRARWAKAAVVRQRGVAAGAVVVVAVGGVTSPAAAEAAAAATATRAAIRRPPARLPSRRIVASAAAGDATLARGPRPCRSPISRLSVALRPPAVRGIPAASCASARARPRASSLARPSCGRSGAGAKPGAARPSRRPRRRLGPPGLAAR